MDEPSHTLLLLRENDEFRLSLMRKFWKKTPLEIYFHIKDNTMKFFKIYILVLLTFFIFGGFLMYGVLHGKMTMVRIVAMSEDKSLLFIGELSRLQIFGFLHYHMYEFHTSLDGESESKKISFQSFSRDIDAHDRLRSYNDMNNHETTESQIKLQYETDSQKILNIDSSNLTAQFITKTDPNYLRYVSS
jgi:hypothetical protein